LIKRLAAEVSSDLGLLDEQLARAISQAAAEVERGSFASQFVVDVFQTGSGTSTNMNANEVIANRAAEILGQPVGKRTVHPNDHVNLGQSSNDVIPTALHVSALQEIDTRLIPALSSLQEGLEEKAAAFQPIIKIGRTHLQDAVPIRLGQVFSGYASMIRHGVRRVRTLYTHLSELALGGTAVGTGLNCHPEFPSRVIAKIAEVTGLPFREAENRFEGLAGRDAAVEASGQLKVLAVSLMKIANDLRWLSSGPRCGIGELDLPAVQPGSSIMPGKVNPVIPEAVAMVAAQVIGNDTVITVAGQSGNLELNVMKPVIAQNLLQSIEILSNGCRVFQNGCVQGLVANAEQAERMVENSLAMVTALVPKLGYDRAAEIAKRAYSSGRTIREVCLELEVLPTEVLNRLLDPSSMTGGDRR
jgi:fumarate hydratase class II